MHGYEKQRSNYKVTSGREESSTPTSKKKKDMRERENKTQKHQMQMSRTKE